MIRKQLTRYGIVAFLLIKQVVLRYFSVKIYAWKSDFLASQKMPLLAQADLFFLEAWVPCLYPFFSFLWTCLRLLILPVPVVFLLIALVDQEYLLLVAPPPREADFLFCKWKLLFPLTLEIAWEWQCFLPAAGVPLV